MDDSDTAEIELSREEAREVINALSSHHLDVSGNDERRTLDVRDLLQREFDFDERQFNNEQQTLVDSFVEMFDESDEHEIQLSRAEAREIVPALADQEAESNPDEAETIADIRNRFEQTFDLDADYAR